MKIFILDDEQYRHDVLVRRYPGNEFRHAYTAQQAQELLAEGGYAAAFLDHDLGDWYKGEAEADPVERTGLDVVRFLLNQIPQERWPRQVVVHSWNGPRGRLMTEILKEQGIDASYVPFSVK